MDPTLKAKTTSRLKDEIATLPPRMREVAKYILDHPAEFGLASIRETASQVGVSTFTLVRMAHRLGFDSYDAFRDPFRHALVSTTEWAGQPGWLDEMRQQGAMGETYADAALNAMSVVQTSLQRQVPDQMGEIVERLLAAPVAYVTAVRATYAMAYFFHYVGRMALPALQLIPRHMGSAIDELGYAEPGAVVIAITVTPYSRETIEACRYARARGLCLVLISDSPVVAPEVEADYNLVVSLNSTHHFGCYAGLMAVLEALLALLAQKGGQDAADRIKSLQDLRGHQNAYLDIE